MTKRFINEREIIPETRQAAMQGEVVLYQPDESISLELRVDGNNLWLNRQQMSQLFERDDN